jgi:predicted transposase YbfD/YdcC
MKRTVRPISSVPSVTKPAPATPKKVAGLPVDDTDEVKQTNAIGMAIPRLAGMDITGKTITADALLTQRDFARYLVEAREAHHVFTVKDNQPTLREDMRLFFERRNEPDFREPLTLAHGRLEARAIWTTTQLNDYLEFPCVGQAFAIERLRIDKKTGETSTEVVYGLTDHSQQSADPARLLAFNRAHWGIEAHHYILKTGTETRTTAPSAPATDRRTSHGGVALPSVSSSPKAPIASPPPSTSWHAMFAVSSITCV